MSAELSQQKTGYKRSAALRQFSDLLSSNVFLTLAYVLVAVASISFAWWGILANSADFSISKVLPYGIPLTGLFAFFLYLLKRWRLEPEKAFYVIGVPAVLLFALFMLPGQVPDEIWHIYRAFDLKFDGSAMTAPVAVFDLKDGPSKDSYAAFYSALCSAPNWADTVSLARDLSYYLVHLYFLPSVVIDICQLLNVHPLIAIILARFANAGLFLVAGYWIIKMAPLGKTVLFVYLLNPMMVQQQSSLSADAICNITTLLFVVYLLRLRFGDKPSGKQLAVLVGVFMLACISKYAYAVLGLLFLLLVPKLEKPRFKRIIYVSTGVVAVLAVLLVVLFYNGDSYRETMVLLRDPAECATVMAKTFYEVGPLWVKEFFGLILGALNITVWEPCFWAYAIILMFAVVFNLGETNEFHRVEKIFMAILAFGLTFLLIVIWREWTLTVDMRSDIIMGAQGRYFIPYVILLYLSAVSPRCSLYRKNVIVFFGCILALIFLIDGLFVIRFFV